MAVRDQLKLGVQGAFRLGKTGRELYPRAFKWMLGRRKPTPAEVRELFDSLGTTYIKIGQFIASSPSIFPEEYVEEFQSCQDKTPALRFSVIRKTIEQDLQQPLEKVFRNVDPLPLGSASIAQVHAATLLNGDQVVVKVQKPGVKTIVQTDLNALFLVSRVMELILPNTDKGAISDITTEMFEAMIDECDFRKEADNLLEFNHFLRDHRIEEVVAPKPYMHACGDRVLTMERLYGTNLTDKNALAALPNTRERLFSALNTWFQSVMNCGFFHADLHSGNLLMLDNGKVGFIDFGMIGRIDRQVWEAAFGLFTGLGSADAELIARSMINVGMTRARVNAANLQSDIENLMAALSPSYNSTTVYKQEEAIGQAFTELGKLARNHGIRFPRAFTLLVKQFLYFDSYLQLLSPGDHLFDEDIIDVKAMGF